MVLDKNYKIKIDFYNFTLVKEQVTDEINKKTGKPVISHNSWHYPSLKMALDKYINEALRPSETIGEVSEKLNDLVELIKTLTEEK